MEFKEAARRIMKKNRITLNDLANRMNLSRSTVAAMMYRSPSITYNKLLRLFDALGYDVLIRERKYGFEVLLTPTDEVEYLMQKQRVRGEWKGWGEKDG